VTRTTYDPVRASTTPWMTSGAGYSRSR